MTDNDVYPQHVGSLFTGIGGVDLGLERAGMTVKWQSEIDPHCNRVLGKHWPATPNLGDITKIDWKTVDRVDLLCGGFPCQDISSAHTSGRRAGLYGKKSGLWSYMRNAIVSLAPQWIITENVSAWQRWVPRVRADLAQLGWASLPVELPAGSFGAPHRRPRIFVVAHADSEGEPLRSLHEKVARLQAVPIGSGYWRESFAGPIRVDDGLPDRMDRLKALGNAVVPQVAEALGLMIREVAK